MINLKRDLERLISAYLDGEINAQEAQRLSDYIRRSPKAKAFFLHSCALHKSILKLYGKTARFSKLAAFDVNKYLESPKILRRRAISEWSAAACLFAAAMGLMCAAMNKPKPQSEAEAIPQDAANFETRIADSVQLLSVGEISIITLHQK